MPRPLAATDVRTAAKTGQVEDFVTLSSLILTLGSPNPAGRRYSHTHVRGQMWRGRIGAEIRRCGGAKLVTARPLHAHCRRERTLARRFSSPTADPGTHLWRHWPLPITYVWGTLGFMMAGCEIQRAGGDALLCGAGGLFVARPTHGHPRPDFNAHTHSHCATTRLPRWYVIVHCPTCERAGAGRQVLCWRVETTRG